MRPTSSAEPAEDEGPVAGAQPLGTRQRIAVATAVVVVLLAGAAFAFVILRPGGNRSSSGGAAPTAGQGLPARPGGGEEPASDMHPVFRSEFAGATLDPATWSTCYPWADDGSGCTNFGNPEVQWYLPSQVRVSDQALHLVASRNPTPGESRDGGPQTYPWRSGMVTTYRTLQFTYGLVEVEARAPRGDGLWTALWLLPADQSFPPEIDIAEVYGVDTEDLNVAYHAAPSGRAYTSVKGDDLSADYHRYAVDWEPDSITWYLDGRSVYQYRGTTPSQPMYFLANLAVANIFGAGPTASTPSPSSLDIRSVVVSQR